jgi:SHS2 domain-containing protein
MAPYREIEHTADWALEVRAASLPELFVEAAHGMFDLAGQPPSEEGEGQPRRVELEAEDLESMLVAWLQELLYLSEVEGVRLDHVAIEALTPTRLSAAAQARPAARPEKAIKAVTYHNLAIRRDAGGYVVVVVFDV